MTDAPQSWKHWRQAFGEDGLCRLTFDKADSSSNTLSSDVLDELSQVLDGIEARPGVSGLIFLSAKSSGFIHGADVSEFGSLEDADDACRAAASGQALMRRIHGLGIPTVACINGFALGGGLELALACTYRVAVKAYERTLGLPEVQLGIHPGFGGTVRSVELLGPLLAMDLMLTGRSLSPVEAHAAGLVDRLAEESERESVAVGILQDRPPPRVAPLHARLLNLAPIRALLARSMLRRVGRRARIEQYPAPFAIVELWRRYGGRGYAAYEAEVRSIGRLLVTPTCKNLVRTFMLRERLRNIAPKTDEFARVHVVGAGIMGGDIASWCALRGLDVTVQDRAPEYVEPALARANKLFQRRLKAPGAADAATERMRVDIDGVGIADADVIIEAIVENLDAKRSLFAQLEDSAEHDAVLATNTSSIRIEEIASALRDSTRLVGIHFFNPVARLPLVEVIQGPNTSDRDLQRAVSFVTQIGKLPLPCRSAPGFVVNRILMPYMLEALQAHLDGHSLETIDAAATRFGMPTGPIELADRVGLDVALHVATILAEAYGRKPPEMLEAKVQAGQLGAKTGSGFYVYADGRPRKERHYDPPDADLTDRLILALVNEAVACLSDGIVADADLVDAGVIFGTGFAPYTGGPINYARQRGTDAVHQRLHELAEKFGPRFEPHHGWKTLGSNP